MSLTPIWKKKDPFGDWIFGLVPDDVEKVRQGFACGRCLEEFVASGVATRLDRCPVCREPTTIDSPYVIVPTPEEWNAYLREQTGSAVRG